MKSLITALLVVFSSVTFASTDVARTLDCRELVATTAVMVTNQFSNSNGAVKSIDAPIASVKHVGNSSTMFISQVNDQLSMIAGKDMWTTVVTRVSAKGTEVFTYGATTRPDAKGQCMMMEITMLDKRT